ncbi:MAG: NmrA family protein, partial [Sphingobacteriales bacterium]
MEKEIVVAGGTGNLGDRIIKALLNKGAKVRAIVRPGSDEQKVGQLDNLGAKIIEVD